MKIEKDCSDDTLALEVIDSITYFMGYFLFGNIQGQLLELVNLLKS